MWNRSTQFPFSPTKTPTQYSSSLSFYEKQTRVGYCHFFNTSTKVGCVTPHLFPDDAKQYFGISEVYDITKITEVLPSLLTDSPAFFTYTSADASIHSQVQAALKTMDNKTIK